MSSKKRSKRKAFDAFVKEFKYWQNKLQCNGYNVYFVMEKLKGSYAAIEIKQNDMVAHVYVNKDLLMELPKSTAKHEACHLFLSRLEHLACTRRVEERDVEQEWERLANVLEAVL